MFHTHGKNCYKRNAYGICMIQSHTVSVFCDIEKYFFLYHKKRKDAHLREDEVCRKRPRSAREFCRQNSLFWECF